jgi:hypothetical protein
MKGVKMLLPLSSIAVIVIHLLSCLTSATANQCVASWWCWEDIKV